MAPLTSKRRKLDQNRQGILPAENSGTEGTNSDAEMSSESEDAAPAVQSKKTQTRLKRPHGDDKSAIYSGGSFKSSLFKLQVDELLSEVQPNYEKRLAGVNDALRKLKGLIEGIEDRDALSVPEATKSLYKSHKVTVPFPEPKPDPNAAYKLAYAKPSNINVVGSYALKTMVKSDTLSVDLVVVMPVGIFQEKDYLNYRYFYKRAYYLACIAAGLQGAGQIQFSSHFEYLHGNTLQPILVVKPKAEGDEVAPNSEYTIRIIPAAPPAFFPNSKLRPTKNSVRPKEESRTEAPPTPFYNATLQSDCNLEPFLKLLHASNKTSPGFKESSVLGRVWLRQRGFGSDISKGGFGHFEWAALTALLLKGGGPKGHPVLSPAYSSYQMFKAVLQFLSTNDLRSKPFVFDVADWTHSKSDLPMVYDGQRGQNLLYKMSAWSYVLLQAEAKAALNMLNDLTFDQFESTFIIKTSQPLQRYDCLIRVPVHGDSFTTTSCDHLPISRKVGNRLYEVLRKGLMDRVKLINLESSELPAWSIKATCPSNKKDYILVSVVFDPDNVARLVDHGPPAEEKKEAAKFQKFWGEKAELRRFKDGSILESLVWSSGTSHSVFQTIVTYLVKRHFGEEAGSQLVFTGQGYEKLLPDAASATRNFDALKDAYRIFENQVRDLEGLPLQLRQLSPVSPQLRFSSRESPDFNPNKAMKIPADVLIQFEGSGRWPDDVVAIQRTKIAFLLRIGTLLEAAKGKISTRLGLENEDKPLLNCAFLDVFYLSGAVFRLRIHNDREQTLLERQIKDKSVDQHHRENAVTALAEFKRSFIQLPLLTQSISTHCTRFPLLSPTIRLVKTWFDRHMLSGHISEELIELIVARTFLQPYPWQAPSSLMAGFLRTLLSISRWDWRQVPLIVDFTGTMTSAEVDAINTRLEAWRKIDPSMLKTVLIAASNHDITGTAYTDNGPSKMVAARMTALARSACKLVKEKNLELDPRSLFVSSTTDYDFVIHLSSKFASDQKSKNSTKSKFKNLELQSEMNTEMVGYEPMQLFVKELQEVYTNSIVFFNGAVIGSVIAGLWSPQTADARPFKVNLTYATKPVEEDNGDTSKGEIVIDKTAILSEIARLGGDMISRIEVNR